jgi:hypothetical protein
MRYVAPKLPAAPTCLDALEWGWIDPFGEAVKCVKPKHKQYYSHQEAAGKHGLPGWPNIFVEGYVRYAIGTDGAALFNYIPLDEIKRRVIRFILNHPNITGPVHLDAGGAQNFNEIELLDKPEEAIEFLTDHIR